MQSGRWCDERWANERKNLPAEFGASADALHPEVGRLQLDTRQGNSLQREATKLRRIDVAVDLVAGQHHIAPIDEAIPDHQVPGLTDVVYRIQIELGREGEAISLERTDVRRLGEDAAGA